MGTETGGNQLYPEYCPLCIFNEILPQAPPQHLQIMQEWVQTSQNAVLLCKLVLRLECVLPACHANTASFPLTFTHFLSSKSVLCQIHKPRSTQPKAVDAVLSFLSIQSPVEIFNVLPTMLPTLWSSLI